MWHLELPAAIRQFDYNTISDVIIILKYTARDGGETLRADATTSLSKQINQMLVSTKDTGLMRIFSAKNDLSTEWYRFMHPVNATDEQTFTLILDNSRFPLFVQGRTIKITAIELVADATVQGGTDLAPLQIVTPSSTDSLTLTAAGVYGSWLSGSVDYSKNMKEPGTWVIKNPMANQRLKDSDWKNMVIIVRYQVLEKA